MADEKIEIPAADLKALKDMLAAQGKQLADLQADKTQRDAEAAAVRLAAAEKAKQDAADEAAAEQAVKDINAFLDAQEKVTVELHQNDPGQPQLQDEVLQVNGSKLYLIKRGEQVSIPRAIYEAGVQAGRIKPIARADAHLYPKQSVAPNHAAR